MAFSIDAQKQRELPSLRTVDIVVAATSANGIGAQNKLPWSLRGDMANFRAVTIGAGHNAVIMGRRTWASIPSQNRPLAKRLNVVLSTDPDVRE